tara:strand:+ start:37 stop:687 length:651 start_codon:yes stop_codon:yes gene_type:complete
MKEYNHKNLKLINADCIDIMKGYKDNYFDLAIVDPPYQDTFKIVAKGQLAKVKENYNLKTLNGSPKDNYWNELKRVSKNQIIWGVNHYNRVFGRGRIVWDKDNTGLYSDCELAYHSYSDVTRKVKIRWNGMLQYDMKNKEKRIHPTQKPIRLYEWLLNEYAKKDYKIIDTHLGSASSAIASYYFSCKEFVGIEIDNGYFDESIKRIKEQTKQIKLF